MGFVRKGLRVAGLAAALAACGAAVTSTFLLVGRGLADADKLIGPGGGQVGDRPAELAATASALVFAVTAAAILAARLFVLFLDPKPRPEGA